MQGCIKKQREIPISQHSVSMQRTFCSYFHRAHFAIIPSRFHLRGSFVFEIIFVACWFCSYFYMVKLHHLYNSAGNYSSLYDTNVQASISFYGYGFVVLNIVQGAFVLCFHCMQNERVSFEMKTKISLHVKLLKKNPYIYDRIILFFGTDTS